MADQSEFEIVQVGGIEGNIIAAAVSCAPSTPFTSAATNLQTALNETADFILALAGQPKFQGGLGFNDPIPTPEQPYVSGDYFIFRDSGDRTVAPVDSNINAGDWAIYTDAGWVILNYSFLNVVAKNIPYDPATGNVTTVAAALDVQAAAIADNKANADKVEFAEYDSIQDIRNKTGKPIMIYLPTDNSIMTTNLRVVADAMPTDSVVTAVVGDANSEAYYITGIAYGCVQLWKLSANRAFGQFFSKEGSNVYTVSFDPQATTEIFYKITPTYDSAGTWSDNQMFDRRVEIGNVFNGGTTASLIVKNQNSGAAVPIISAVSANGTEKWLVDNGGHTTQSGTAEMNKVEAGTVEASSKITCKGLVPAYLEETNPPIGELKLRADGPETLNLQHMKSDDSHYFLYCSPLDGSNKYFRVKTNGNLESTGYAQLGLDHSDGAIPTLVLKNKNTGNTSSTIACLEPTSQQSYFTVKKGGNVNINGSSSRLYVQNEIVCQNQMSCGTIKINNKVFDPDEVIKLDTEQNGYLFLNYNMGNNTAGTLRLQNSEQSYANLWLNCTNTDNQSATIKLRTSGWGSFSGGTDKDVSLSNTATVGERYDGSLYNDASQPALTVKNASTSPNALSMAVKDHAGNNSLEVSTKGHVKLDGAEARLDVDGDIWNSQHDIHTSTLHCGIMNANLAQPYTCNVGGDHTVGGTLTVQGHVVSEGVNMSEKISEYQMKIATLESKVAALEALDLSAINMLIASIQQSND